MAAAASTAVASRASARIPYGVYGSVGDLFAGTPLEAEWLFASDGTLHVVLPRRGEISSTTSLVLLFSCLLLLLLVVGVLLLLVFILADLTEHRNKTTHNKTESQNSRLSSEVDKDKYRKTLDEMYKVLLKHRGNDHEVDGCPLLHYQARNEPPFRWLMLNLTGSNGNRTTLAIRQDNLYLAAFRNRTGRWFVFKDERFMDMDKPHFHLSFKSGYRELVGGHGKLTEVQLGHKRTQWAIDQLSCYHPGVDDGVIKVASATLIVTFCETSRFVTIRKKIEEGWMNGTTLDQTEIKHIVRWKTMCCAMLRSKFEKNDSWDGHCAWDLEKNLGIQDRSTARGKLIFMIWAVKCPSGNGCHPKKHIPIKGLHHPCAEGAGENEGVDDQAVKVDIVDTFRLQLQPPFDKKQFA